MRITADRDRLIASIFSDETERYRTPAEPEPWDAVSVRLRICRDAEAEVTLLKGFPAVRVRMYRYSSDDMFDWYEAKLYLKEAGPEFYTFYIEAGDLRVHYDRVGPRVVESAPSPDASRAFRILPGFHVPEWAKGAVQYQIMVDRFRNGDPRNDVRNRECRYEDVPVRRAASWDEMPMPGDFRCFYGGDLQGVMEKLDYLQSLGVEAVYFNPIFVSPSSHKYDTQDYMHIDPHFSVIPYDRGRVLGAKETNNANATRYIHRTTDPGNLERSDAYFALLCREMHRRGMRIILDGVFNHCGSFSRWMNRERLYGQEEGAFNHADSPYRSYFRFERDGSYSSWWDIETLPKLCYEQSADLCEAIFRVGEKWASPPYSIDGWRLDVAADLGLSQSFNHLFWKEFRRRMKAVNPDLLIVAEHYGDPSGWLEGDEWDTVMNYDAFMEPVTWFLTGMEKHSDYRRDDLYQNGVAFFEGIMAAMARMPVQSAQCAMDELSNHDHSRFMTRTNGVAGRVENLGSAAADEGIRPGVFREAVVIQMTWPGAPTIYYGDEAGLTGWTDPDNRRTYPWGDTGRATGRREDRGLIDMHRALNRLRKSCPALRRGSVKPLCAGEGHIAYARFDGEDWAAVAVNNTAFPMTVRLPLCDIGVRDDIPVDRVFVTDAARYDDARVPVGRVSEGVLELILGPVSAAVIKQG